MATVSAIFQPVLAGHQHAASVKKLLKEPSPTSVIISSAFANSAGVNEIIEEIRAVSSLCEIFIGVRNGSTTAQAVARLLSTGANLYLVDTAMRTRIFHPKMYLIRNANSAKVILGSANLTHAGLFNNIEAGVAIDLDSTILSDQTFLDTVVSGYDKLKTHFPEHCFQITSGRQVVILMREGVLEDERQPMTTSVLGAGLQGSSTSKSRINLPFQLARGRTRARRPTLPSALTTPAMASIPHYGALLWAKADLRRTDLQLLTTGHNPGVLRLTQAKFMLNGTLIDPAIYFRYTLFGLLLWLADPNDPGKEMADIKISLVIAGVYVGDYDLRLSHKPAWASGQSNYTTGLHWENAVYHIRNPGLLGRTLRLYEPVTKGARYVIEVD